MSKTLVEYKPNEPKQFILAWEHNGVPWAETHRIHNGVDQMYDTTTDEWIDSTVADHLQPKKYVLEEIS